MHAPAGNLGRRRLQTKSLGAAACLLAALLAVLSLLPYLTSGTELVRLRNALTLGAPLTADFDWQPPQLPGQGYLSETAPPEELFVDIARELGLAALPDDWQRAVAIVHHLNDGRPPLKGGALMSNLHTTYQRITGRGEGYCGDFVRVFHAIAHAAGMTTRSWAFSFDGFGGHGHVWAEVWNRQQHRWELIGPFLNLYFVIGDGPPLSALQLRQAMLNNTPGLRLTRVNPGVPMGFAGEAQAWDYFRRGLDQWYLVWGDNIQTYDQNRIVRAISGVSRGLEQLAAISQGLQPSIRILPTPTNQGMARKLRYLRWQLGTAAVVFPTALMMAFMLARRQRAARARA